jgi:hypothetical protein
MQRASDTSLDLTEVLSSMAGRQVRIGEIIEALNVGRSTYYEQRDEGRLLSADNLLRMAEALSLNPVELMVRCGALSHEAATAYAVGDIEKPAKRRRPRLELRGDLPPL